MTFTQEKSIDLTIEGITQSTIIRYFETLNAGDFTTTASLFALDGELRPPFEEAVVGKKAIATYLEAEAVGMQLKPHQGIIESIEENSIKIRVSGKVQTPLFGVNVSWCFVLTPQQEIASVEIKLLASPQELLRLRG